MTGYTPSYRLQHEIESVTVLYTDYTKICIQNFSSKYQSLLKLYIDIKHFTKQWVYQFLDNLRQNKLR